MDLPEEMKITWRGSGPSLLEEALATFIMEEKARAHFVV